MRTRFAALALLLIVSACGAAIQSATPTGTSEASAAPETPTTSASVPACAQTDQDASVYHPLRLEVVTGCRRVSGTVAVIRHEADGDLHILLALDPPFIDLLRPANQGVELGDLVVEPVCVNRVTQADAKATCAADHDPLTALPTAGMHVWMEGRYVLDLEHGGWTELHPLFRWGVETTAVTSAPSETQSESTAQPTGTPLPTPSPKPTSRPITLTVRITSVTSPAYRNSYATLTARTHAGARCSIEVDYKSGPSTAAGLYDKSAGSTGVVSWTWKVGGRTTRGVWPIYVTCDWNGQTADAQTSFRVA